jgi:hypothetical protein
MLGVVVHTCNSSTQEAQAEGAQVPGQPGLHSETQLIKNKNRKGGQEWRRGRKEVRKETSQLKTSKLGDPGSRPAHTKKKSLQDPISTEKSQAQWCAAIIPATARSINKRIGVQNNRSKKDLR